MVTEILFRCARIAGLAFLALASPLTAARASADPIVLGSVLAELGLNGAPTAWTDYRFTLAMSPTSTIKLFSTYPLNEGSVGATFTATAANDPQFAEIASQMTNGVGNYIEILFGPSLGGGAGQGWPDEGSMFGLGPGFLDFRGAALTAITLHVDELSIYPSVDYAGMNDVRFRGRVSVIGEGALNPKPVPEPATLMLLTMGMAGLVGGYRRRPR